MIRNYEDYLFQDVVAGDAFVDPAALPLIKNPLKVPVLESSIGFSPFEKSSSTHGRTMEDPLGVVFTNEPIADENGDIYTTYSIKGADSSLPVASYNPIEHSYVRVRGMLDSATFPRCQAVSRHLRGQGVLTEWPILHARPKLFPDGEKDIPLNAYRSMLYENYLTRAEAYRTSPENKHQAPSIGKVGLIGQGLAETKFSVMYRAMLSNIRLWELTEHKKSGQLDQHITKAIKSLQLRKPKHFTCWSELEKLDPSSPEDQTKYITEVLPAIMGENLARFHNSGSYHKYLHGGNWTLAGEIVDLDSVTSVAVDPEEEKSIGFISRYDEVHETFNHIISLSALVEDPKALADDELVDHVNPMQMRFRHAYFAERFLNESIPQLERVFLDSDFLPSESNHPEDVGEPMILSGLDAELEQAFVKLMISYQLSGDTSVKDEFSLMDELLTPIIEERVIEFLAIEGLPYGSYPKWLHLDNIVRSEQKKFLLTISRVNRRDNVLAS